MLDLLEVPYSNKSIMGAYFIDCIFRENLLNIIDLKGISIKLLYKMSWIALSKQDPKAIIVFDHFYGNK